MSDTSDTFAAIPHSLGDLHDVDAPTTVLATGGTLVKGVGAGAEWAKVAPAAAIPNLTVAPTAADINTILAALRLHGIVTP